MVKPEPSSGLRILLLGDIILDVPEPDHWFSGLAPMLNAADLAIGHLEVPHTRRGAEMQGDVPAPGADPAHLSALARAGIGAVSLAGNHMADQGADGIADTIATLDGLGIAHAGAGPDLATARRPALMTRHGRGIALLSYNCVGPESAWAGPSHAGTAYIKVRAADGGASRPQADLIEADPQSLADMADDIALARTRAGLVIVALHKGITHRPALLAPYERPVARAAIDAGADIVVGHHAHIARGIEIYRGKPIYHGLGNGVVVTHALSPDQDHPARAAWARARKAMFGFEPDPAYPLAPFHPEAVNAMAAYVDWQADGALRFGFVPLWSEPPGRPLRAKGTKAETVSDYIDQIGVRAGLAPLNREVTPEAVLLS
jgi:poly-gamma-glutamate synthesis protein (capsule biosynthesis protein)